MLTIIAIVVSSFLTTKSLRHMLNNPASPHSVLTVSTIIFNWSLFFLAVFGPLSFVAIVIYQVITAIAITAVVINRVDNIVI